MRFTGRAIKMGALHFRNPPTVTDDSPWKNGWKLYRSPRGYKSAIAPLCETIKEANMFSANKPKFMLNTLSIGACPLLKDHYITPGKIFSILMEPHLTKRIKPIISDVKSRKLLSKLASFLINKTFKLILCFVSFFSI